MDKVNCFHCSYFRITHNPEQPYACGAFGFRSKELPSLLVKKEDGKECLAFNKRTSLVQKKSGQSS